MPTAAGERPLIGAAGSAAGTVLRGVFAAVSRARPADKPLHPRGVVLRATVHRYGSPVPFGVAWLDEAGRDPALVRFSRSVGLPEAVPDVLGIALRVAPDALPGDLLFATTGRGPLSRFLLVPRRAGVVSTRSYSTLLPYRTPRGPVVLSATPTASGDDLVIRLAAARPTGPWHPFGSVTVQEPLSGAEDRPVNFDPLLNEIPELANYPLARRVREGAYAAARRARGR